MEDFPPSKGGQRTYFSYYPLFLHFNVVRGGTRRGDDGDIIMIIVLSILLFFLSIFTFLAYKPTPLLRVSAPTGKITHKALQQDCKIFFGIFKNVKKF